MGISPVFSLLTPTGYTCSIPLRGWRMSVSGELYTCHFVSRQRFADTMKKELGILIPEDASVQEENRAQLKGELLVYLLRCS